VPFKKRRKSRKRKNKKKLIMNKQVRKGKHVTQYYMIEFYRYFRAIWWL
jgi:hypothetical protein